MRSDRGQHRRQSHLDRGSNAIRLAGAIFGKEPRPSYFDMKRRAGDSFIARIGTGIPIIRGFAAHDGYGPDDDYSSRDPLINILSPSHYTNSGTFEDVPGSHFAV